MTRKENSANLGEKMQIDFLKKIYDFFPFFVFWKQLLFILTVNGCQEILITQLKQQLTHIFHPLELEHKKLGNWKGKCFETYETSDCQQKQHFTGILTVLSMHNGIHKVFKL